MSRNHPLQLRRRATVAPCGIGMISAVFLLLMALVTAPVVWAAPYCSASAGDAKPAICHECCAATADCCAFEQQHEPRPVEPANNVGSSSNFDASLAALSSATLSFLNAFSSVEQTPVYPSETFDSHAIAPRALSCIRLI